MTSQKLTYVDAIAALKIQNDPDAETNFNLNGQAPADLVRHSVQREYILLGISPEDYINKHGASEFSLSDLQACFKTICEDYMTDLVRDRRSMAVEFCSLIIYEIGPESRKGSKTTDKIWKMRFPYNVNGRLITKTLFVATYRTQQYKTLYEANVKLVVTVKQAGLFAMDTFDRLTKMAYQPASPLTLLTPLAGSIFSRDDIPDVSNKTGIPIETLIIAINNSCQSGGQYLNNSSITIAIVSAIVATRNIKDKDTMNSIIGKTIKQFLACGKVFKEDNFLVYSSYAHGGIPSNMAVENLISTFTKMNDPTMRNLAIAAGQTQAQSNINVPTASTP